MQAPRTNDFPLYINIARDRAEGRLSRQPRRVDDSRLIVRAVTRAVEEKVARLVDDLTAQFPGFIPLQRKYTVEEVRIRLYTGRDPNKLTDAEHALAESNALSTRTIERLVAAGDLQRLVIGGSRFFSETQVQEYERRLAEGQTSRRASRRGGKRRSETI